MNRRKFAQTISGALVAAALQLGCSTRLDKPTPPDDGRLTNAKLEEIYQRMIAGGGVVNPSVAKVGQPTYGLVITNDETRKQIEDQGYWPTLEAIQEYEKTLPSSANKP